MNENIQLYAIGNALVDTEIPLSDAAFKTLGIDKGTMTLIDEEKLTKQLQILSDQDISLAAGGSAANSIYTAAKLGAKTAFSGLVADDKTGHFFMKDLEKLGIRCKIDVSQSKIGTGRCLAYIHPDAQRTFETYLGISAKFSAKDLDSVALEQAGIVYCEGYLLSTQEGFEACLEAQRKSTGKIAITLSDIFMVEAFRDRFKTFLTHKKISYLFCNEAEICAYSQKSDMDMAVNLVLKDCETVIVTQGEKGASIYTEHRKIQLEGKKVKAINTNGAGDTFAGAFLFEISQGNSLEKSGMRGIELSAKVVQQSGPRLTVFN
ncbi:MAG: adenosine kinase [bacterium]